MHVPLFPSSPIWPANNILSITSFFFSFFFTLPYSFLFLSPSISPHGAPNPKTLNDNSLPLFYYFSILSIYAHILSFHSYMQVSPCITLSFHYSPCNSYSQSSISTLHASLSLCLPPLYAPLLLSNSSPHQHHFILTLHNPKPTPFYFLIFFLPLL